MNGSRHLLSPVPLAPTALLLVLMVEVGTASFTFRNRAADPLLVLARAVTVGLAAMVLTQFLAELAGAADARGVLIRALGVTALVVAAGWVTLGWRRSEPEGTTQTEIRPGRS